MLYMLAISFNKSPFVQAVENESGRLLVASQQYASMILLLEAVWYCTIKKSFYSSWLILHQKTNKTEASNAELFLLSQHFGESIFCLFIWRMVIRRLTFGYWTCHWFSISTLQFTKSLNFMNWFSSLRFYGSNSDIAFSPLYLNLTGKNTNGPSYVQRFSVLSIISLLSHGLPERERERRWGPCWN